MIEFEAELCGFAELMRNSRTIAQAPIRAGWPRRVRQ